MSTLAIRPSSEVRAGPTAQLKKNVVEFGQDQFATDRKEHDPSQEASKEQFEENIGGGLPAQPTADACVR